MKSSDPLPRSFWVLFVSRLVNRMGSFVVPFLAIYLAEVRHAPLLEIAAVLGSLGVGALVAPPLGGVLADHFGRRITLVGSLIGAPLLLIAVYLARSPGWLEAAMMAYGFVLNLGPPAQNAMVADIVRPASRRRAYATMFWASNLGFSAAMIGAGLLSRNGFLLLFLIDGSSSILSGLVVLLGTGDSRPQLSKPQRVPVDPKRERPGILQALSDPLLMGVVFLGLAYATLYQQASITLPLAMIGSGLSSATYGVAIAANGILIVILQPLVSKRLARVPRVRLLAASTFVVGLGFAASAFAHSALTYGATIVLWTLGEIGTAGLTRSLVADISPANLRGRYAGVQGLSWGGARLTAPLAGLYLLHQLGSTWLFISCGVDGALVAAGYLFLQPSIRKRVTALRSRECLESPHDPPVAVDLLT
ncbi:MAG: MFS transporter [Acidimicrobiales bacterium]